MLITGVQSEQLRILQAHGELTTPRVSQILDHRADALQWVADNWRGSKTSEANLDVRQIAAEALASLAGNTAPDRDH